MKKWRSSLVESTLQCTRCKKVVKWETEHYYHAQEKENGKTIEGMNFCSVECLVKYLV